jgi:hypothetical protein
VHAHFHNNLSDGFLKEKLLSEAWVFKSTHLELDAAGLGFLV